MQSFTEFITEGRDAPLYHATWASFAIKILEKDVLEDRTMSGMRDSYNHNMKREKHYHGAHYNRGGVSLTRSLKTASTWGMAPRVIFELDQAKLVQNVKLSPLNVQAYWTGFAVTAKDEELYEERTRGPITNLSKYLKKVIVLDYETFVEQIKDATGFNRVNFENNQIILNHKLLYDLKTKKFINQ